MEKVGIGPAGESPRAKRRSPLWAVCQKIAEADDHEWRRIYVTDDKPLRDQRIRSARHRYGPPTALGWQFSATTSTSEDGEPVFEIWAHYQPAWIEEGVWENHADRQRVANRERNRRQRAREKAARNET